MWQNTQNHCVILNVKGRNEYSTICKCSQTNQFYGKSKSIIPSIIRTLQDAVFLLLGFKTVNLFCFSTHFSVISLKKSMYFHVHIHRPASGNQTIPGMQSTSQVRTSFCTIIKGHTFILCRYWPSMYFFEYHLPQSLLKNSRS